jgi:RNA polymerase sigma factor (TIGR02999 family)
LSAVRAGKPDYNGAIVGVTSSPSEVTELLRAWGHGDESALERLTPLVASELSRLARTYLRRERVGHTLQPTALINEVYLRLIDWRNASWEDRSHFFGVAARLMRRVLIDHARRAGYQKRGGAVHHVSLDEGAIVAPDRPGELLAIDEALVRLAAFDSRKSEIVELRFFGGLSVEETAEVLKVSPSTVKREWRLARAWLYRELTPERTSRGDGGRPLAAGRADLSRRDRTRPA